MKIRALIPIAFFCFLLESAAYGQYDQPNYNAPAEYEQAGQILEEACDYRIKTFQTKKQVCTETLQLISANAGQTFSEQAAEQQIIYCIDQNEFTAKSHTFFVNLDGHKTMTKTKIVMTGDRNCTTDFIRVFAHYRVTAEGRIEFVPSQLKAHKTTCQ